MAVWILIPEDGECARETRAHSAFLSAAVAFFVFERLDKTQLAVISRAWSFVASVPVVSGAMVGILPITTQSMSAAA